MNPNSRYLAMEYGPVHHNLCNVHHSTGTMMARKAHHHDFYQIYVLLHGVLVHETQTQATRMFPGDCFLIPPYHTHRICPEGAVDFYSFSFYPAFLPEAAGQLLLDMKFLPRLTPQAQQAATLESLMAAAQGEFSRQNPGWELVVQGLLQGILVLLHRACRQPTCAISQDSPVLACLHYIHTHYQQPLCLSQVLEESGLSESTFLRSFKKLTGQTYRDYLTSLRLQKSCALLQESDKGIGTIAEECGYRDVSSFYRAFEKQMHCSPGAYRAACRQGPPDLP